MVDVGIKVRVSIEARLRVEVDMAQNEHWWIGSDVTVKATVWDEQAEVYLDDATVMGVLKDAEGDAVSGASSITFASTGANGEYVGTIPDTVSLTNGEQYTLEITTTAASGEKELTHVTRTARKRAA